MPEGLSADEVGKEIAEHDEHAATEDDRRQGDRWLSIIEAVLLSLVAVLAAYSGYAAAKWGTESSVTLATAKALDAKADAAFAKGAGAGATADKYIRDTVFLATVLFLVGIGGHFRIRSARLGLIGVGTLLLIFAVVQLLSHPGPPG